ncbi:MAG: hypothetical protein EXR94_12515 [Gemmatimonadetes bacterium]|nr:hypothetical protein [Gemmatimonadota bacterium]
MNRPIRLAFLALLLASAAPAQPNGKIDLAKMRPTGLLVDAYSYMSPPHNAYYFHHIDQLGFRIDRVRRSGPAAPLATGPAYAMPDLEGYFARNQVTGFLVLRRDTVLLERYLHGADRRAEDFSFQMTTLLHRFPEDHAGFDARLQLARLHTLTRSRAASTVLAEEYNGL